MIPLPLGLDMSKLALAVLVYVNDFGLLGASRLLVYIGHYAEVTFLFFTLPLFRRFGWCLFLQGHLISNQLFVFLDVFVFVVIICR
jgi:hypothetical protein